MNSFVPSAQSRLDAILVPNEALSTFCREATEALPDQHTVRSLVLRFRKAITRDMFGVSSLPIQQTIDSKPRVVGIRLITGGVMRDVLCAA